MFLPYTIESAESARAKRLVDQLASYPLHKTHLKTGKCFYCTDLGAVAFEKHMGQVVVAGDPVAATVLEKETLLKEFQSWAHRRGYSISGYYFSQQLALRVSEEFEVYRAGVSHMVSLPNYSIRGHARRDVRRALNQGVRGALLFGEIPPDGKEEWLSSIEALTCRWFRRKRRPAIRFLLSQPQLEFFGAETERWFIVTDPAGRQVQAMVSVLGFEQDGGVTYYVDQLIQDPQGHRFALDYLIARLIAQLRIEGASELSLGLSPFHNVQGPRLVDRLLAWLGQAQWLYNSRGIYQFKKKFTSYEQTRFLLLDREHSKAKQLAAMTVATFPQVFRVRSAGTKARLSRPMCPRQWHPTFWRSKSRELRN